MGGTAREPKAPAHQNFVLSFSYENWGQVLVCMYPYYVMQNLVETTT